MSRIFEHPKHWLYVVCHMVMVLVGFILCSFPSNTVMFAVGGSMIAAGCAGWVIFVYVWLSEDVSDRVNILSEFGFVNAFGARSVRIRPEYEKRLEKAREKIDIIGFGLSAFREDFGNDFATWKQKASVRILLIDPEFPTKEHNYALQRDSEERNTPGKIINDVKLFIKHISLLIRKSGEHKFEIRLYRCLPTLNIFRIDDDLFWGPYLIDEQSRNCPTFLVRRGGILFEKFSKQFDRIWESDEMSRPVPDEWQPE